MQRLVLSLLSLLAISPQSHAQEALEQLRAFGARMTDSTWQHLEPANQPDEHSYRWQLGERFIMRVTTADPRHLAIIGVNPETKKVNWWTFKEDGSVEKITWIKQSKQPTDVNSYIAQIPDGEYPGSFDLTFESDVLRITSIKVPANFPAKGTNVWKRKPIEGNFPNLDSAKPATIPANMSIFDHLTGSKWIEGRMPEGNKTIGSSLGKWILGGKFFLYTASFINDDQSMWSHLVVAGIDPATGQPAHWEFTSDGAISYATNSPDGYTIHGKQTQEDGTKTEFNGKFTMDGEVLKYTSTIGESGKDAQPYNWTYHDATSSAD